jgi:hypothetical protein
VAINVVLDPPKRRIPRPLSERAGEVIGQALVVIGLVASVALVVLAIPALASIAGAFLRPAPGVSPSAAIIGSPVAVVWLGSIVATGVGLGVGRRVLRGRRRLVLFLRRFRNRSASDAVTFAVAKYIGRSWRLITLDDSQIAPVGLTGSAKRMFALGGLGARGVGAGRRLFLATGQALGAIVVLMALMMYAYAPDSTPDDERMEVGWNALTGALFDAVVAGHPMRPFGINYETGFLVLAVLAVAVVIACALTIALVGFVRIALLVPLSYLESSYETTLDSVRDERRRIMTEPELDSVVAEIRKERLRLTFPRLTVVRVRSEIWQRAVTGLAGLCHTILVDVSEPTESLVWEVESLQRHEKRFLVVGDQRLVADLVSPTPPSDIHARLADRLRNEQILVYSTDDDGRKRFGRALRDLL